MPPVSDTTCRSCEATRALVGSRVLFLRGGSSEHLEEPETMAGFHAALLGAGPETLVVIDFGASWCGPCRAIAPEFERLAEEYAPLIEPSAKAPRSVIFVKVDIDKLPEAAEKYRIQSLPTFVFLKGGEEVERFSGANLPKLKATLLEKSA